ncbi:MAG: helix-turn-helix transcriptional regulator [Deltaproteobacteria bacterium]|nr:helix-turn-helix transcriptional regulator [Deltaproteobacteria bacterium]MBW2139201.1 helix-turn-helix transcriptional regulator [Deltaproteobacteria bacterium]
MPNIAVVLREEITRLARKELRTQTQALRKASAEYRKKIAEMKRQLSELQRKVASMEKRVQKESPSRVAAARERAFRFSAKGLRSSRKRLGLSASDFGRLIGVTGQTVYKWENEASRPREQQLAALAAVRGMGKREAQEHLKKLSKE